MNGKITNHLDFFISLSFHRKSAISFWLSTNLSFGGCNTELGMCQIDATYGRYCTYDTCEAYAWYDEDLDEEADQAWQGLH